MGWATSRQSLSSWRAGSRTMEFNLFWRMTMIINSLNGQIINSKKIYLHDDILENLIFHRNSKNLHLSLSKSWPTQEEYTIDFLQVIGFEMTSCDFWGASPHILDFEYVENGRLISKLFSKRTEYDSFCALKQQKDYIETVLTFISGDTLTVACEEVVIGEAAL